MRQPRNFTTDRCYHLVSRIANRAFYLSEEERTRFVDRMWRVAYFSCIDILAYCVMNNHFHILVYVPPERELPEDEVLARVRSLYFGDRLAAFERMWAMQLVYDDPEKRKPFLARYTARMWSVSEFMKTLKQLTSQSFNSRRDHTGTIWESRFHARMMTPEEKLVLMKVAGYIDRNPVKARLVKWPDEYRWCGFAAACAGDMRCIKGYRFIYTFALEDWSQVRELHEISIGLALKELEDDQEAREAFGSYGGSRLSVTADRLEGMRTRRRERMEMEFAATTPNSMPKIIKRGNRRVAHDILTVLAEGPRRPVEIRDALGIASANYFTACYLTPMRRDGYIELVDSTNPYSSRQAYRITPKGREAIGNV